MTAVVISQPMLFPWPGFFEQMMLADAYCYLEDVQFSKGSFTNRVQIKCGERSSWISIPLKGTGSFQEIRNLEESTPNWRARHLASLLAAYKEAPFRVAAMNLVEEVYSYKNLCDLLIASIEVSARYLDIGAGQKKFKSSETGVSGKSWPRVLDLVKYCGGSTYISGHGGANYLDHEAFEKRDVAVVYMYYSLGPWPQLGNNFTPFVSILDLIANAGPKARDYLRPITKTWRAFKLSSEHDHG